MMRIESVDVLDQILSTLGAVITFGLFLGLLSYGWFRVINGL